MSKVGFDFSELEELKENIEKVAKSDGALEQMSECVLNQLADIVLAATKSNTPVRSGNLRRNWRRTPVKVKISGNEIFVKIYNNTEYAPYVEYGHRIVVKGVTVDFQPGVFMLTMAVENADKIFPKMVEEQIAAALEGIAK
ncbi:MAG: HK97 gp10 family phage protein [Eubacteriales bacterium]|nr:HK97 gp10 family phage protein [Eubacteriales bacterium]